MPNRSSAPFHRTIRNSLFAKEVYQNNIHIFTKSRKCNEVKLAGGRRVRYAPASYATLAALWNYATLTALWICYYDTVPKCPCSALPYRGTRGTILCELCGFFASLAVENGD